MASKYFISGKFYSKKELRNTLSDLQKDFTPPDNLPDFLNWACDKFHTTTDSTFDQSLFEKNVQSAKSYVSSFLIHLDEELEKERIETILSVIESAYFTILQTTKLPKLRHQLNFCPLTNYLESGIFTFSATMSVELKQFKEGFLDYVRENEFKRDRWSPDFYSHIFWDKGLALAKKKVCREGVEIKVDVIIGLGMETENDSNKRQKVVA